MKQAGIRFGAWIIALSATWATGAGAADKAVLDAARTEGKVVFYSSMPSGVLDKLVVAFNKKYAGITAEYYRSSSTGVLARLDAELSSNRLQADLVYLADNAEMDILKKKDRLQPYVSPEYRYYPKDAVDVDGTWYVSRGFLLVIGYNPKVLPEARAPKTWTDLNDPSLVGKIGITDPRNSGGNTYWRHAMWKLHGAAYTQALARNKPLMQTGFANLSDKVISGELAAAVTGSYLIDEATLERKAPIRAVFPPEGSPLVPGLLGIVKSSPHPNAAKVLLDFTASVEGQRILNSRYTYSMRPDVPALPGMRAFKDIKVLTFSPEEMSANQVEVQRVSREPFGLK